MSTEIEQRLTLVEAENQKLRAELADLKQTGVRKTIPSAAPSNIERQVTISTPTPVSTFKMPTDEEMTKLINAVARRYPVLIDATFNRENFEACFLAIGNMRRTPEPNHKVYLGFHTDTAQSILVGLGRPRITLLGHCFLAAAFAHFDVPVSGINRHSEGIVPEVGLHEYVGRSATDAWRRIIEGQAPRECAVQRVVATSSPARVYGQGY